jgi:hypothetical protein
MRTVSLITLRIDLPAHFLDGRGQRGGFVLLAAFLGSLLFIRTSARLTSSPKVRWWPESVKISSGLHLHHLVRGIVLMMLAGFLGFAADPTGPETEILAALFGIGLGLTLDEFALWIHLRDVYWAEEGRCSLDAVIVATVIGGLLVRGAASFDIPRDASSVDTLILAVVTDVLLATLAILEGRRLLGLIGIFIRAGSFVSAVRLASPWSPWAQRFYDSDGRKLARSRARFERIEARRRRIPDAIVGAPEDAAGAEAAVAVQEAASHGTVREE